MMFKGCSHVLLVMVSVVIVDVVQELGILIQALRIVVGAGAVVIAIVAITYLKEESASIFTSRGHKL